MMKVGILAYTSSKFLAKDAIFIFSVGGGDLKKCFCKSYFFNKICKKRKAKIFGIVGRKKVFLKKMEIV